MNPWRAKSQLGAPIRVAPFQTQGPAAGVKTDDIVNFTAQTLIMYAFQSYLHYIETPNAYRRFKLFQSHSCTAGSSSHDARVVYERNLEAPKCATEMKWIYIYVDEACHSGLFRRPILVKYNNTQEIT